MPTLALRTPVPAEVNGRQRIASPRQRISNVRVAAAVFAKAVHQGSDGPYLLLGLPGLGKQL
jgi:hypothetical protein